MFDYPIVIRLIQGFLVLRGSHSGRRRLSPLCRTLDELMQLSFDKAIVNVIRYCKTLIYHHKDDSVDALTGLGSVIIIQQWTLKRDALLVSPTTRMDGVTMSQMRNANNTNMK